MTTTVQDCYYCQWALVLFANAVLISLGVAVWDASLLLEPAFYVILINASLLCVSDLVRLRQTSDVDRIPSSRWAHAVCFLNGFAVMILWWSAIIFARRPSTIRAAAGIVLALVGAIVRGLSVQQLGANFVSDVEPKPNSPDFNTANMFGVVRHPSELGLWLVTLSACLLAHAWQSYLLWACLIIPLGLWRIYQEEKHLLRIFGRDYGAYRRRVGMIIPRWIHHR